MLKTQRDENELCVKCGWESSLRLVVGCDSFRGVGLMLVVN